MELESCVRGRPEKGMTRGFAGRRAQERAYETGTREASNYAESRVTGGRVRGILDRWVIGFLVLPHCVCQNARGVFRPRSTFSPATSVRRFARSAGSAQPIAAFESEVKMATLKTALPAARTYAHPYTHTALPFPRRFPHAARPSHVLTRAFSCVHTLAGSLARSLLAGDSASHVTRVLTFSAIGSGPPVEHHGITYNPSRSGASARNGYLRRERGLHGKPPDICRRRAAFAILNERSRSRFGTNVIERR